MTFADFLHQAGFWQWIGMLTLAAIVASGISKIRLWGNITKTKTKTKNIHTNKDTP